MEKKQKVHLRIICVALSIGALLSGVSLLHYIEFRFGLRSGPTFCNLNERFNCDVVTQSGYSSILGVPIASYGLVFYLMLLALAWISLTRKTSLDPAKINRVLLLGSVFSCIFSVYLFLVSELVIGVLCPTCLGMYLCNAIFMYCAYKLHEGSFWRNLRTSLIEVFYVFPRSIPAYWHGRGFLYERRWLLLPLVILSILVFLAPFLMTFIVPPKGGYDFSRGDVQKYVAQWKSENSVSFLFEHEGVNRDYTKGNPFASVTIVEFSDFECPACHEMNFDLEELLSDFGDSVRLVFKNFPLDKLCNPLVRNDKHTNSCLLAQLARCAGEQEKFWEAVDYLMELDNLSQSPIDDLFLAAFGGAIDLDQTAIKECLDSQRHITKIKSDVEEGIARGVSGTPAIYINGKKIPRLNRGVIRVILQSAMVELSAKE